MTRKKFIPVIVSALLALTGCGSTENAGEGSNAAETLTVTVAPVKQAEATTYKRVVGIVNARNVSLIETKIQARVENIAVNLGTKVRNGDLLAELDTRDLRARVELAKAVADQAARDLTRFETLLSQQAATQQEFDAIKTRAVVAASQLAEAEAMLNYARIVSPIDGVVTQRHIDVGDLAVPARPLFEIQESGSNQLIVTIPETDARSVRIGDSMRVEFPTINTPIGGLVTALSPNADPRTGTQEAKVALPQLVDVRPGQFGRLLVPVGEDPSIFIDGTAVLRRGQLELVYLVENSQAALRYVRTGKVMGGKIEILSGLSAGDSLITSNHTAIYDGQRVRIAE